MRYRSLFCLGLAFSLSLSLLTPLNTSVASAQTPAPTPVPTQAPAPAQAPRTFRDVPADYWAKDYIAGLSQFNIISGFPDGTFRPNEPVTRAQFAAILNQAFMSAQPFTVPNRRLNPTQPSTPAFADVPNNHWAAGYIAKARTAGFLSGYPGNLFKPNQPIPRVQALVSIANGLDYQGGALATLSTYKDAAAIPEYARPGIAAAKAAGIVVNYPALDQLMPNRPTTRAEVAAFVYQALVKEGRAQPVAAADARWNGTPIATLPTDAAALSFSADGQRLLVLTAEGAKLQIWNTKTGALIREIAAGDQNRFSEAAISKDGTKVAAIAQTSPHLSVWAVETGQPMWQSTTSARFERLDPASSLNQIAFSADGQRILLYAEWKTDPALTMPPALPSISFVNAATGEFIEGFVNPANLFSKSDPLYFSLSPNGQFMALVYNSDRTDGSQKVDLWRLNQKGLFEYARTLPQFEYADGREDFLFWGLSMAFTNDGLLNVLTRSPYDGFLVTWNPQTGAQVTSTELPADRSDLAIALSPDGDSYYFDGDVVGARLGSAKTGEVQDWSRGYPAAFSDRGNHLAIQNYVLASPGTETPPPSISIYAKTAP